MRRERPTARECGSRNGRAAQPWTAPQIIAGSNATPRVASESDSFPRGPQAEASKKMLGFHCRTSRVEESGDNAMQSVTEVMVLAGIVMVLFVTYGGKLFD